MLYYDVFSFFSQIKLEALSKHITINELSFPKQGQPNRNFLLEGQKHG
jgi:hypothetical protein